MEKEQIQKMNTQELFNYAYALGWKEAMEKVKKEAESFYKMMNK